MSAASEHSESQKSQPSDGNEALSQTMGSGENDDARDSHHQVPNIIIQGNLKKRNRVGLYWKRKITITDAP